MTDRKDEDRVRRRANELAYRERNREKIRARERAKRAAKRAEASPLHNPRGRPGVVTLLDKVVAVSEACRYINRNDKLDQLTKYRAVQAAVASFELGDEFWTPGAVTRLTSPQWVNRFIKAAM